MTRSFVIIAALILAIVVGTAGESAEISAAADSKTSTGTEKVADSRRLPVRIILNLGYPEQCSGGQNQDKPKRVNLVFSEEGMHVYTPRQASCSTPGNGVLSSQTKAHPQPHRVVSIIEVLPDGC